MEVAASGQIEFVFNLVAGGNSRGCMRWNRASWGLGMSGSLCDH